MPKLSTQLSGSHVLIAGGTKGIGRALVEAFLVEGANVSYCSRSARGDEFSRFKDAADGARAVGSSVDMGNQEQLTAWVNSSAKEFGRIDSVVTCAASIEIAPTKESWTRSFEIDILGLIALIDASTPHLAERKGSGTIVVYSSLAGFEARHPAVGGPYSVFKRAQATMAKDYARKLSPLGIRINTIVPGTIETPNITHPDGTVELSTYHRTLQGNPEVFEKLKAEVPLKRTGTVEEAANLTLFLASHLSGYVNGASIFIDGGMSTAF